MALLRFLEQTPPAVPVRYVVDAAYVRNLARERDVVLVLIPTHVDLLEALAKGVRPGPVIANAIADQIAGHFSEQVQVPYAVSASVQFADALTPYA